jgi:hypothetical protein
MDKAAATLVEDNHIQAEDILVVPCTAEEDIPVIASDTLVAASSWVDQVVASS